MAVYAVGDIQGCFASLTKALNKVKFDPSKDVLWCVGDLVNRGPDSLATLRYLKGLGDACISVLGNHDLHLLELAAGGRHFRNDTFKKVLRAEDFHELIDWLRFRPMMHVDESLGWVMVHAGLHPEWSLEKAAKKAGKVEKILRGNEWKSFCLNLQKYHFPHVKQKQKQDKHLYTTAVMTRTRHCTKNGVFDWQNLSHHPAPLRDKPWFKHKAAAWRKNEMRIVFGHWAALGLVDSEEHVLGLDSGCVWGGCLTLARLDTKKTQLISVNCPEYKKIK